VLLRRRSHAPLAAAALLMLALAPTFGVLRWSWIIAYDNYAYWPLALMAVAAGWWLGRDAMRKLAIVAGVIGVLCVFEAAATRRAHAMWRDSTTLWTRAVTVSPSLAAAHNGLATAMMGEGRYPEALGEVDQALAIDGGLVDAAVNRGSLLIHLGRPREALDGLKAVLAREPNQPTALYFAGLAAQMSGDLEAAARYYQDAIRSKIDYVEARDRLGTLMVLRGDYEGGVQMLKQSVALAPGNAHAHFSLAMVLLYRGEHDAEAITHLDAAIAAYPKWTEPAQEAAWLLATSREPEVRNPRAALERVERMDARQRSTAAVLDTEAAARAALGDYDQALVITAAALSAAKRAGADSLFEGIRRRQALYERGRAYVQ
jgi:tetratricopeptide (TPR) repeat protein